MPPYSRMHDGSVSAAGNYPTNVSNIRPALKLNLASVIFTSKTFTINSHIHSYAWGSDAAYHWQQCTAKEGRCDVPKKDETGHSYGESGEARFTCKVCGYVNVTKKAAAEAADTAVPGNNPTSKIAEEAAKVSSDPITISKAPTGVKAKAKKNKVTVTWKKIKKTAKTKKLITQIKSIQVQVAKDKTFTDIVANKKVGKNKTKTVLKLKKKTTYYIRIRYVGSDGVSKWSSVKKVKTK